MTNWRLTVSRNTLFALAVDEDLLMRGVQTENAGTVLAEELPSRIKPFDQFIQQIHPPLLS